MICMQALASMNSSSQVSIAESARKWWSYAASVEGRFAATRRLLGALWEFARDSTPERLRARYGDADYDWEYRVNTTSGAVGWRDRLIGVFHSGYQPTEPAAFHEMLQTLQQQATVNFEDLTFIDFGSGKGRTLLMASDYPFRKIVGVELLPSLHAIAQENILKYKSDSQKSFAIESICGDAVDFVFPDMPLLVYLFNPLPESGMRQVFANLQQSLAKHPRPAFLVYHNPLLEHTIVECMRFKRVLGNLQYSLWSGE
jgi:hypothetical protein